MPVVWVLQGCAGSGRATEQPRPPIDSRFEEPQQQPYRPPARRRGQTGELSAIVISGGEEQARRVALGVVKAVLELDDSALSTLLAERIVYVPDGRATTREELIEACLSRARSFAYQPDLGPDDLIDVDTVAPLPLSERYGDAAALPAGLLPSDLAVGLPTRNRSTRPWQRIPCLNQLYIRPGPRPRVVGLGR